MLSWTSRVSHLLLFKFLSTITDMKSRLLLIFNWKENIPYNAIKFFWSELYEFYWLILSQMIQTLNSCQDLPSQIHWNSEILSCAQERKTMICWWVYNEYQRLFTIERSESRQTSDRSPCSITVWPATAHQHGAYLCTLHIWVSVYILVHWCYSFVHFSVICVLILKPSIPTVYWQLMIPAAAMTP